MLLMHLKLPASLVYALPIFCNSKFVTIFRKTNLSARKSIIAYARKYAFEQEDANVNKEKEARFTRRRNVGLASNLDGGIFSVKGNKAINKNLFFSLTGCFSKIRSHF